VELLSMWVRYTGGAVSIGAVHRSSQYVLGPQEVLSVWVRCTGGALNVGEVHRRYCHCEWCTQEVLSVWVRYTVAAARGTINVIVLKNSFASEFWTSVTDHRMFFAAPKNLNSRRLSVRNWRRCEAPPLCAPPSGYEQYCSRTTGCSYSSKM